MAVIGKPKQEATWQNLIIWIAFNDSGTAARLSDFHVGNIAFNSLNERVNTKFKLAVQQFFSDIRNIQLVWALG